MGSTPSRSGWRRVGIVLAAASALVLMLGTSVTAARMITGKQIKDGTVTGVDLRNGSVTGVDVRDGSLSAVDYAGVVVGPRGPSGAPGPAGPAGAPGSSGLDGFRDIAYAVSARHDLPSGRWIVQTAKCPPGTTALAGGFAAESGAGGSRVLTSAPLTDRSGWSVGIKNEGSSAINGGYGWVTCARTR